MANWNKNPPFIDIENINANNKFETGDGITYHDMNTIVENLQNLKNTGGGTVPIVQTTGQSTTDVMSQKAVTDAIDAAVTTALNTEV